MFKVPDDRGVIRSMIEEVASYVEAKGWNDDRTFGDEAALLHSEISEALESYREHGMETWETFQPTIDGVKMPKMTREQINCLSDLGARVSVPPPLREGVGPEFAGLFVRLLDDCGRHGIDLWDEYRKEMDYNWTRSFRHGNRAL